MAQTHRVKHAYCHSLNLRPRPSYRMLANFPGVACMAQATCVTIVHFNDSSLSPYLYLAHISTTQLPHLPTSHTRCQHPSSYTCHHDACICHWCMHMSSFAPFLLVCDFDVCTHTHTHTHTCIQYLFQPWHQRVRAGGCPWVCHSQWRWVACSAHVYMYVCVYIYACMLCKAMYVCIYMNVCIWMHM